MWKTKQTIFYSRRRRVCPAERDKRAEELRKVQYLGALLRKNSCSFAINISSALPRGTFIYQIYHQFDHSFLLLGFAFRNQ